MRKMLFTLVLSLAVVTASFHAQVKRYVIKEKKTSKSISLIISTVNNYDAHIYQHCQAQLDYTVVKVRGIHVDTIVQKQFSEINLRELPAFAEAFHEVIDIQDVSERREEIIISYNVSYTSKGSVLKVKHEKLVPREAGEDLLGIHI